MAIMYQESGYRAKAKPPRRRLLWVIPTTRLSDAYGYAQAKDATWDWYREKTGNRGADRDEFEDAIDFIAWYGSVSQRMLGISSQDAYNQYLAYHEGHRGYQRRTFADKKWLLSVAKRVATRADHYRAQFALCEGQLREERRWWPF